MSHSSWQGGGQTTLVSCAPCVKYSHPQWRQLMSSNRIPTEAFDQVLQVQELERRLEFSPWTHEEKVGVKCDTIQDPFCSVTATGGLSHKGEYSHE